jgi:hypothetical protein
MEITEANMFDFVDGVVVFVMPGNQQLNDHLDHGVKRILLI